MKCVHCGCECDKLPYDGMWPSDWSCPVCGRVYDGDTGDEKEAEI